MKQIRLLLVVVLVLLASTVSATVFQPTTDRDLVDRSEAVVVATVRDAFSHLRADGYVVTDYRFDVEETLKGSAGGVITVTEIGGAAGDRFTFIADSASYTPGERVLVFLKKRSDGTWFTTSMAMGKFAYGRDARGEAIVMREVSELRSDPARLAGRFERFVRDAAQGRATTETMSSYATTFKPIAEGLRPISQAFPASAYCISATDVNNQTHPVRWDIYNGGAPGLFHMNGTQPGMSAAAAASAIANGLAAWTNDPNADIVLGLGSDDHSSGPDRFDGQNVIYLGFTGPDPAGGFCDGANGCTIGSGVATHTFHGETFFSLGDTDIIIRSAVGPSQFEAFITHELGHAIGLRHSNQGTPSDSSAVMTSPFNPGFGSSLQSWDTDANDTVYGNGPPCVVPSGVNVSGGGSVPQGSSATLNATVANGTQPFTYQWYDGNSGDQSTPVGTNSSQFTTPPINSTKNYWVKVTNSCGSANSQTVTITPIVCVVPSISAQPNSQTITSGTTANLSVVANGTQPLGYQWYRGQSGDFSNPQNGANSSLFTTPALTQQTSFWVNVTNSCGNAMSNTATISIAGQCTKPSFTTQPSNATIVAGTQLYLIAFATNVSSYQWYKGTAPDTSTPVTGLTPSNSRWISQIYIDLLGRPADASAQTTLGGLLTGGSSRSAVALVVMGSTEYRSDLIKSFFATYLRRPPSAAEITFWLPAFTAGLSDEQVAAQIIGSPEYFALSGGTNAGWINRIFNDVLGRAPSAADMTFYTGVLGSASRTTVGLTILNSSEAATRRVQGYYPQFLRRSALPAETSGFVALFLGGLSEEQIIATIVGADEYFNFGTLFITDPINNTTSFWVRATNACGTTDSSTAILTVPTCAAPVIITQPKNTTVNVGVQATASVLATGATSYQWYRAQSGDPSNPVAGATGPVLMITLNPVGVTSFWVKVSNACSSTNSQTMTVTTLCAPRTPALTLPPTAPSAFTYTVSWTGSTDLDLKYELQEATKADFSDAATFTITQATSRNFTHIVTTDTRYYYRLRAFPACGGDAGPYSPPASIAVTAPPASTRSDYSFARPPCTTQTCIITQPLFIAGFVTSGKTGIEAIGTFSVTTDEPWMTVSPSSGALPPEGVTVTLTIDAGQLDGGSTQGSVSVTRTPGAGKIGALDTTTTSTVPVSVSLVAPVTPKPKDPNAPLNALLIPAVAHADGIGSRFVSDVRLTNTADQPITYQLTYTPTATDGTLSGKQATITVKAGQTMALNDIVKDWYGSGTDGEPGIGTIEIRPQDYSGKDPVNITLATVAASRTYSVASTGTFGQFVPAIPLVNFLAKSDVSKISLQAVSNGSGPNTFRTNVGFVEGSGQPVDMLIKLLDDKNNLVTQRVYSLKPYEHQQLSLPALFGSVASSFTDGRVEVTVTSDTGHVTAYASVLDNTTTDPLLVFPADPSKVSAKRFVVPGVADFSSSFSNFHTNMRIFNGGASAATVNLSFVPTGGGTPVNLSPLTIAAGEVKAFDNVLPSQFNVNQSGGVVTATTTDNASLILTASTFSRRDDGGTFGQFIPGVTSTDAVGVGDRTLQVVQLEESPSFRSNLGLVEVTGSPVTIEILGYSPDSKVAARTTTTLTGGQYIQLGQIFKSMGFTSVYNGRVSVRATSGTGRVAAYGSIIDNRTSDPTYVPAQ